MPRLSHLDFGNLRPTFEGTLGAALPPNPPAIPPAEADRILALIRQMQAELPLRKLALFARRYETDEILARLPVMCRALVQISIVDPVEQTRRALGETTTLIGSLATDHTGYAAFDLVQLGASDHLFALAKLVPEDVDVDNVSVALELSILPFGDTTLQVDALAVGDQSHDTVVVRLAVEEAWLDGRGPDLSLPSLQDPGIDDWRLSPGSFALSPDRLIGDGGCEDLWPSDLSTQQFKFSQIVRLVDKSKAVERNEDVTRYRYGYRLEFENRWYPIGHSLGQVAYSLPLAPGETVNLAISDWSRTDSATREERTALDEGLLNDTQRDRTISEVIRGVISESQEGSSVMGGLSTNVLLPVGGALIGGALGLGGTSSDSSGVRNVSTDMTQRLNDRFRQSSSAIRELRSTVITQTAQAESGRYETRSITNYNHCHTMTVLYHEVLRHYRIQTRQVANEPVVLVTLKPGSRPDLQSDRDVLAHRRALEAALLDPRHLRGFEALVQVRAGKKRFEDAKAKFDAGGSAGNPAGTQFSTFTVMFRTGDKGTDSDIFLALVKQDGSRVACRQIDPPPENADGNLDTKDVNDFEKGSLTTFDVVAEGGITWGEIDGFVVRHQKSAKDLQREAVQPGLNFDFSWMLRTLRIIGARVDGGLEEVVNAVVQQSLMDSETAVIPVKPPADAQVDGPPVLTDFVPAEVIAQADMLHEHLADFGAYYRFAALFGSDPIARVGQFRGVKINQDATLYDLIEPRPVGHVGDEIAFRLTDVGDRILSRDFNIDDGDRPSDIEITNEDLISLPTRGVFAEGKLGHCSTCEKIDDTRFWDFQTSPLPNSAPQIAALATSGQARAPTGLSPSDFPKSLLSLQTPASAPDPAGLTAALQALATGNAFRDMSGNAELGKFLGTLTESNAEALTKFAELQQKKVEAEQKPKLIDQIKNMDNLTPDQISEHIGTILGGGSGAGSASDGGGSGGTGGGGGGNAGLSQDTNPSPDGGTPKRPTPTAKEVRKSIKPKRAAPPPAVDKLHMLVDIEPNGVLDPREMRLTLTVDPVGQSEPIRVGPTSLLDGFLRVELPALDVPEGQVEVRIEWPVVWDVTEEAKGKMIVEKLKESGSDFDDLMRIARLKRAGYTASKAPDTFFKFEAGARVVRLLAEPIIDLTKVKDTSFASAELKVATQLGIEIAPIKTTLGLTGTTVDSAERELQYEVLSVRDFTLKQV